MEKFSPFDSGEILESNSEKFADTNSKEILDTNSGEIPDSISGESLDDNSGEIPEFGDFLENFLRMSSPKKPKKFLSSKRTSTKLIMRLLYESNS